MHVCRFVAKSSSVILRTRGDLRSDHAGRGTKVAGKKLPPVDPKTRGRFGPVPSFLDSEVLPCSRTCVKRKVKMGKGAGESFRHKDSRPVFPASLRRTLLRSVANRGGRGGLDAHGQFDGADLDVIAVGQRGAGDRLAVDQERLRRRQLADAGAAGRAVAGATTAGEVAAGTRRGQAGAVAQGQAGAGVGGG